MDYLAAVAALRKAVDQVGSHRAGCEGWWLAVRDAAAVSEASYRYSLPDTAGG